MEETRYDSEDYLDFLLEMKAFPFTASERELYEKFFRWGVAWGAGKFMPDVPFLNWLEARGKRVKENHGTA